MALNLLKLCVGCDSVEDLEEWIAFRLDERRRACEPQEHFHTTRMVPTRGEAMGARYHARVRRGVPRPSTFTTMKPWFASHCSTRFSRVTCSTSR